MKFYIFIFTAFTLITIANGQTGQLDKSFNATGKVITPVEGKSIFTHDMLVQQDGKILLAGIASTEDVFSEDFAVVRYTIDGKLDSSFNNTGIQIIDFEGSKDECYSMILQADGKIILNGLAVLSNFERKAGLVRLNNDGSLDESFGINGKSINTIFNNSENSRAVLIDKDGKIILTGSINSGSFDEEAAIFRYNYDGTLDETFGNKGIVSIAKSGFKPDFGVLQPDGKIINGGTFFESNIDVMMFRFNSNGTLDSTFGINGVVQTDYNNEEEHAYNAILQEDNKLLVVIGLDGANGRDFCMIRYNEDGSIDNSFGVNGRVVTDFSNKTSNISHDIAIQKDQKIILSGFIGITPNHDFAVARYNSDGSLDSDFGTGGKLTTNFFTNDDLGFAMGIQEDSKIVVAGHSNVAGIGSFAAARYLSGLEMLSTTEPSIEVHNLIVYPNPVVDEAVLEYTLDRDQVISIGLYDMGGRLIQSFVKNQIRRVGLNREVLINNGIVGNGHYVLVVKNYEKEIAITFWVNK